MTYAIILSGGAGTRFWPLSRQNEPKQFLNICQDRPMIELTIKRIRGLIKKENIFIATNRLYHHRVKNCLRGLAVSPENILLEPQARNTFAPIAVLAKKIYDQDPDAIIIVMPCDHYIRQENKFLKILKDAVHAAKAGFIVTLGIKPDRPETGYGYIRVKGQGSRGKGFYLIDKFIEKPDVERAMSFIKNKRFYWNGGIFIFRAFTMMQEIKKFLPADFNIISRIKGSSGIAALWPKLTSISIDYAVMEKTDKMALIPADVGWMDLGSWEAIEWFSTKDDSGNVFKGKCVDIGSRNTLVWSDKRVLATIGLKDMIVVDTADALLVCAKDKTQDVKLIVQKLKERKLFKQI